MNKKHIFNKNLCSITTQFYFILLSCDFYIINENKNTVGWWLFLISQLNSRKSQLASCARFCENRSHKCQIIKSLSQIALTVTPISVSCVPSSTQAAYKQTSSSWYYFDCFLFVYLAGRCGCSQKKWVNI